MLLSALIEGRFSRPVHVGVRPGSGASIRKPALSSSRTTSFVLALSPLKEPDHSHASIRTLGNPVLGFGAC